jgi:hypothetical protein
MADDGPSSAFRGVVVDKWNQQFATRVATLRDEWAEQFETLVGGMLDAMYRELSEFAGRCELEADQPREQKGLRLYKFALSEDAYVLLYFRPKGVARVEFEYECSLPGAGRIEGGKSLTSSQRNQKQWAESCFRLALDDLIGRFADMCKSAQAQEPVPA